MIINTLLTADNNSMNQQTELSQERLLQCMTVIDIDPNLTPFRPSQQKWISSIELFSDIPKQLKSGSKILNIFFGLYLVINYCEKNRLPIYQIDFISQPGSQWIPIKMPYNLADKLADSCLCFKTQQLQLAEPLGDIDVINTERKSHFGEDLQVVNVPNGYKVVSNPIFQSYLIYKRMRSRLQQTFKPTILQFYPQSNKISLGLIPSFCFPDGIKLSKQLKGFITFSFVLTQQTGDRIYATFLTFKQLLNQNLKNKLNIKTLDKVYYDKGICVISKYKFSDQFGQCLQHLYRLSMSKNDQPFYKVAQNFITELKVPKDISTRGVSYSYSGCNIVFDCNNVLQTTSDKSIYCMFKFLPLEEILTIFKAFLYERQIIFISQSKTVLGFAIQAFMSFLFPFKWENVIIPVVPMSMKQYLTAPVPYIIGITSAQLIDSSVQTQAVIVLLDSGKIMNDEDLPPLPQKLHKQLLKRLQQYEIYEPEQVKQYLQNPQNTYMFKMMEVDHPEFKCILVKEAFLQFFTSIMKNYKKYWRSKFLKDIKQTLSMVSTEPQLINDMFKVQDFLSDLGMNKVGSFGYKLTEGTMFTAFMQRRYQNSSDLVANFFDDCLQKKKVKKFDGILMMKPEKIRYIVSKHPQPQSQKKSYNYERFPSILKDVNQKQIVEEEIQINFQEQQKFSMEDFYEFLQQQKQLCEGFYEKVSSSQLKNSEYVEILNLLLNKNKDEFIYRVNSNKDQNIYQTFKDIYEAQNKEIKQMLFEWQQISSKSCCQVVEMEKNNYFSLKTQRKLEKHLKESIVVVWDSGNAQILIKEPIKIIITSFNSSCYSTNVVSKGLTKSSFSSTMGGNKKHTLYVYVPNYRIRQFLNRILRKQCEQVFNFMYNKAKNGSDNYWNIETLIAFRQLLEQNKTKQESNAQNG